MAPKELMSAAFKLAFRIVLEENGMKSDYAADTIISAIESGKFYLLMDHPDERYSVNASASVGLRHKRLEAGAPPPSRGDLLEVQSGLMQTLSDKAQQLMMEATKDTRSNSNGKRKMKSNM